MLARVVEILLDKYKVNIFDEKKDIFVKSRGKVKNKGRIKVGDIVELSKVSDEYIITNICERKNDYIRPPVSNIDYIFIVIAAGNPKPDFLLLDKQLIMAKYHNSIPIIVVNKTDLKDSNEISKYVLNTYSKLGYKVILTNTVQDNLLNEDLFKQIKKGSLCAFSGNSGVGKSSIISKIKKDGEVLKINSISDKTGRGRHTTKSVTVYKILNTENETIYFLDTPGFSSFEVINISCKELKNYFTEFNNYKCDYNDCKHINENNKYCKVKSAVNDGNIDKLRYEHYVKIYEELNEKEKRLYK